MPDVLLHWERDNLLRGQQELPAQSPWLARKWKWSWRCCSIRIAFNEARRHTAMFSLLCRICAQLTRASQGRHLPDSRYLYSELMKQPAVVDALWCISLWVRFGELRIYQKRSDYVLHAGALPTDPSPLRNQMPCHLHTWRTEPNRLASCHSRTQPALPACSNAQEETDMFHFHNVFSNCEKAFKHWDRFFVSQCHLMSIVQPLQIQRFSCTSKDSKTFEDDA